MTRNHDHGQGCKRLCGAIGGTEEDKGARGGAHDVVEVVFDDDLEERQGRGGALVQEC